MGLGNRALRPRANFEGLDHDSSTSSIEMVLPLRSDGSFGAGGHGRDTSFDAPLARGDEHEGLLHPPKKHRLGLLRCLPRGMRQVVERMAHWIDGPQRPRQFHVSPILGEWQRVPAKILESLDQVRIWFLVLAISTWAISFSLVVYRSAFACNVPGYGHPVRLSCISRLWTYPTACALNGQRCRPFNSSTFAFRCPAGCETQWIWNPRQVGLEEINYRSLVVGGPTNSPVDPKFKYRGDSFICGAAVHAGLISNSHGGCGVISLTGEQRDFQASTKNGISSLGFLPSFPQAFTFLEDPLVSAASDSQCSDPRWRLLGISVTFTMVISLLISSPGTFFWCTFAAAFFTVALATDPPESDDFNAVISSAFAKFLPAAFVAFVYYKYCVQRCLHGLTAHFEKTVLWLGACWIGCLDNFIFDQLPLQRLTPHDIVAQAGALPTLIVLVVIVMAIAAGQVWAFRREGRLGQYLGLYGIILSSLLLLLAMPGLRLRLHHYIVALLLLPGTAIQTRPSLIYQGLLIGLLINGVGRWGFASIVETYGEVRGDGLVGGLIPQVAAPVINGSSITFDWTNLTQGSDGKLTGGHDSISIQINDVERFRGYEDHNPSVVTWTRFKEGEPEYVRIAFVSYGILGESEVGDYSGVGIWHEDGRWDHFGVGQS